MFTKKSLTSYLIFIAVFFTAMPFSLLAQTTHTVNEETAAVTNSINEVKTQEDFDGLARTFHQGTPYSLPHVMFTIDRKEGNKVYYIDSRRFRFHKDFLYATYLVPRGVDVHKPVYLDEDRRFIVGTIAWQRTVNKFTWEMWEGDLATAEHLKIANEAINKTFFKPVAFKPNSSRQDDVSAKLEIARVLQSDINKSQEYIALNPGKAVGRIHIIDKLDDTVEIGDNEIVILKELPISLPPVRGIIVAKPSSPLSHVNVLAKGWGIPNVYIKDADILFKDKNTFVWELDASMTEYKFNPADIDLIREKFDSPDQQIPPADLSVTKLAMLREQRKSDSSAYGGKASNQGEIINAKIPGITVPDGFSIPFHWYDKFMKDNGLDDVVENLLEDYDFIHNPRYRREKLDALRKSIENGKFDVALRRQIVQKWRLIGYRPVFVRSSSNTEDLPNFSGAGLYSSVPNVRTQAELINAVKKVWASLWRAQAYEARVRNYVSQTKVYMSALVQVGVDMQRGGVLITKDPFNNAQGDAVYISTVCGHNSRVVNNNGLPEQMLFLPASDSISVMTLSDQENSFRFDIRGDLKQTKDKCAGPQGRILTDAEVKNIAKAALQIRDVFDNGTQDIEWGMIGNRLYIFQARPYIDTVKPFEQK